MKIFMDDIREAPSEDWLVCRTIDQAIAAILQEWPTHVSLDFEMKDHAGRKGDFVLNFLQEMADRDNLVRPELSFTHWSPYLPKTWTS